MSHLDIIQNLYVPFIEGRGGAAARREIEAYGRQIYIPPHKTTEALRRGWECGTFELSQHPSLYGPYDAYNVAGSDYNLARVHSDMLIVHSCANGIGPVCEKYVRSLAKASDYFHTVTEKGLLGNILGDDGYKIDFKAICRIDGKPKFLFEIKNEHHVFYPRDRCFGKLVASAVHNMMVPFFVAPFIDREAIELCNEIGIATLTLDRQLFSKRVKPSDRPAIIRICGESFVEFIDEGRPLRRLAEIDSSVHMSRLNNVEYLEMIFQIWSRNSPRLLGALLRDKLNHQSFLREIAGIIR